MKAMKKRNPRWSKVGGVIIWLLLAGLPACKPLPTAPPVMPAAALPTRTRADDQPPLFAYYYIWFDPSSWDRAKRDYPTLGRYSSDDRQVMRQHIRWAKLAGLDGFIVSWKSTDKLNQRLEKLADIAAQEEFALAIIYQGLDFEREPISVDKIDVDLDYFVARYRRHPAFAHFARPLVIWSGTWEFDREEIELVSRHHRQEVLLLASERNEAGYARIADLVAGNAYYWSSVNPATYPNYPGKLIDFGKAIHAQQGLWVAPAAPGFDARMVGGATVVERADGAMFQQQLRGALASQPDVVGVISWNEFSENSHIEPSRGYGTRYLEVLRAFLGLTPQSFVTTLPAPAAEPPVSFRYGLPLLGAFLLVLLFGLHRIIRQARHQQKRYPQTTLSVLLLLIIFAHALSAAQQPLPIEFDSSDPGATFLASGRPLLPQQQRVLLLVGEAMYPLPLPAWATVIAHRWGLSGDLPLDLYRVGALAVLALIIGTSFGIVIRRRWRTPS